MRNITSFYRESSKLTAKRPRQRNLSTAKPLNTITAIKWLQGVGQAKTEVDQVDVSPGSNCTVAVIYATCTVRPIQRAYSFC